MISQIDLRFETRNTYEMDLSFLGFEMQVLSHFYSRLLGKINGIQKINLVFDDNREVNLPFILYPTKYNSVPIVSDYFDINSYLVLNEGERLNLLNSETYRRLKMIAHELNIDLSDLEKVRLEIEKSDFINSFYLRPLKKSPNRRNQAGISIQMSTQGQKVFVDFLDEQNRIDKIELINLWPHGYFLNLVIYDGKWIDQNLFSVFDRRREIFFDVNLESKSRALRIEPKSSSKESILNTLELYKFSK